MIRTFITGTAEKLQCKFEAFRAQKLSAFYRGFTERGQKVLDLGSGSGHIAQQIIRDCDARVICMDVVDYNRTNLSLVIYDGEHIPSKDASFDVILLFFVLHHAADPIQVLKEVVRVLKVGGSIIVLEDIYNNAFEHLAIKVLDRIYNQSLDHVATPFSFKNPEEWEHIFGEFNLAIVSKRLFRCLYPPTVRNIQFVLAK